MLAEEVEEDVGVDLSVGIVNKKYAELESCGSAANFLLGVEMEGDTLGRMEVEGDALIVVETDLYFNANDSNTCQCPPRIVESTTAVDDANVGKDLAADDANVGKVLAVEKLGAQFVRELALAFRRRAGLSGEFRDGDCGDLQLTAHAPLVHVLVVVILHFFGRRRGLLAALRAAMSAQGGTAAPVAPAPPPPTRGASPGSAGGDVTPKAKKKVAMSFAEPDGANPATPASASSPAPLARAQ